MDNPASDSLRVALIGCGLIGRSHATGLARSGRAELTKVLDIDRRRAETVADEFSPFGVGAVAPNLEAALTDVDAVYVCTWTSEHQDLVSAVAQAGLAVFCEKPLSVDLAGAATMTETVRQAGVINQVGLVLRHSPAFRVLQHLVNQPNVGPIMSVVFRDDQYLPTQGMYGSTWRGDATKAGAGTLLEHSIHDLDLIEWLIGPVADVSARTSNHHGLVGIEDHASVRLVGASGAVADLVSVWHDVLSRPSQRRVEVFTRSGYFSLEGDWNGPVTWEVAETEAGPRASGHLEGQALMEEADRLDGRGTNPDADFVDAVAAGTAAHPDFAVALDAHRLADAAYRSADRGGAVIAVEAPTARRRTDDR